MKHMYETPSCNVEMIETGNVVLDSNTIDLPEDDFND